MIARLRVAHSLGLELRTTGIVVAEVWRDASDDISPGQTFGTPQSTAVERRSNDSGARISERTFAVQRWSRFERTAEQ